MEAFNPCTREKHQVKIMVKYPDDVYAILAEINKTSLNLFSRFNYNLFSILPSVKMNK